MFGAVNADDDIELSKWLSWVLRHEPGALGLTLDPQGWTSLDHLVAAAGKHGHTLSAGRIREVVRASDKQRFALSADESRIRAQQGHSVEVELDLRAQTPPEVLFHGTVGRSLSSIRQQGLVKGARHHVHLSPDAETASRVGRRRGEPVVLAIEAAAMTYDGFVFYLTPNGVWLTERVPPRYLEFPPEEAGRESP